MPCLHRAAPAALVALLTLATACRHDTPLHAFRSLPEEGWGREDTLCFEVDTVPAAGRYAVTLCLRAATAPVAYPYTELLLAVMREEPRRADGDSTAASAVCCDTLRLSLTSERGDMEGNGTALSQLDIPLDTVTLPKGYTATYRLCHLMRRDPLPGLRDIGLRLRRLNSAD
jgi:gliding motility-associated lipoprotein GldH